MRETVGEIGELYDLVRFAPTRTKYRQPIGQEILI